MDLPTQTHLMGLRQALEFRLSELRAEIQAADAAGRDSLGSTEVGDRKDDADRMQSSALGDAEEQRDVDEFRAVLKALERLDAGRYGDCADCGEPIGLERLRAQPAAERCARCQQVIERRRSLARVR